MLQRHEHFALAQLPEPHVVLHNRVAARVSVLIAQPFEDPLGRMTLLLPLGLIRLPESGRWLQPRRPAWAGARAAAADSPVAPSTAASSLPSREPARTGG